MFVIQLKGANMKTMFYAIALGAGLLLTGSLGASAQGLGIFDTQRDCASDIQSLCAAADAASGAASFLVCQRQC